MSRCLPRVAVIALFFAQPAFAQGNYQSAPLGGRTTLMGGTGIALGTDGAAPFMNPATIARIEDRSIAFSSRIFRYSERRFQNLHQPGPVDPNQFGGLKLGDTSQTYRTLQLLPNSTCLFFDTSRVRTEQLLSDRAGKQTLAICLGKTEESSFSFTGESLTGASAGLRFNLSKTVEHEWMNWGIGPAWSVYLTDDIAIGTSLFVSRTKHSESVTSLMLAEDASTGMVSQTAYQFASSGNSWDLVGHLGATVKLSKVLTFGASVRAPGVHLYDAYKATYDRGYDAGTQSELWWGGEGSFRVRRPARISLGLGAEWRQLRVELDSFYYTGQHEYVHAELDRDTVTTAGGSVTSRSQSTLSLTEEARPVVNLALGAEWFATRDLSLVGGFITDFSSVPELPQVPRDPRLFRNRANAFHGSAGVVSYSDTGDLLVGLRLDHARGEAAVVNPFMLPPRLERVDYRELGVMFILAGRISLTNVVKAAKGIGDAVEGDAPAPGEHPRRPMVKPE